MITAAPRAPTMTLSVTMATTTITKSTSALMIFVVESYDTEKDCDGFAVTATFPAFDDRARFQPAQGTPVGPYGQKPASCDLIQLIDAALATKAVVDGVRLP